MVLGSSVRFFAAVPPRYVAYAPPMIRYGSVVGRPGEKKFLVAAAAAFGFRHFSSFLIFPFLSFSVNLSASLLFCFCYINV